MGAEQFPSPSTPQGPYDLSQKFAYSASVGNVSATTATAILTQNTIATFQVPYTMLVSIAGNYGFSGTSNVLTLDITDEGGTVISAGYVDGSQLNLNATSAQKFGFSMFAKKQYAPGATCGFRLRYLVNTSNMYIGCWALVQFAPGYV